VSLHAVVSGWLLGAPSGANARLLGLLRAIGPLLGEGERVTVLHRRSFAPPPLHERIAWRAVATPAAPTWRRVLAERRVLPPLLRELGATLLDHALLPAPRVPCPVVLTIHDLRNADGFGRRPRWLARAVVRRSLARAHTVIVPSRFTAGRLAAIAAHPRVEVVPNGTDLQRAASAAGDEGYLLHVGHLEPRKNLDLLLHALALLPPDARPELRLAGADAGHGRVLQALAARLGVAARVRVLGAVPDAELPALYAGARAVVVPSRYEGFGLCALEGLALGRPVLVSDAGALPEVTGRDGVVLPVDDARAWAAAIRNASAGPPRAGAPRRADWHAPARRVLAVWRTACASTGIVSASPR
jgi:glycosyltransferase involved in cell wall biosynthesis